MAITWPTEAAAMEERADVPCGERDPLGAVHRGEIELQYQPVVDVATRAVAGFEALLRWDHPAFGPLGPSTFVSDLEDGPHAAALDRWILLRACCTAATWPAPVHVAVNVLPTRLARPELVEEVRFALAASGLDPARLRIELVERAPLLCHPSAASTIEALQAIGVSLALDDFLVHYSSLGSLGAVPASAVKVDRSFVAPLNRGEPSPIAEAIVRLAHDLGLEVIAEGVETHAGEAAVRALGCELAQGFLYSPAVAASCTAPLLRAFGTVAEAGPAGPEVRS